MAQTLYTKIGRILKKMLGISDVSLLKKNIHKRIGMLLYHRKYTAAELVSLMQQMGMKAGSVVCIHSSMKEFYNYRGTAEELITAILDVLGPEGTLMMPAFPKNELRFREGYVFNPSTDPTGAGYLAEAFRRYPGVGRGFPSRDSGVKRSISVQQSVCAIGKYADFLTSEHTTDRDPWGEHSPWQKMISLGAIVFNLGMPRAYMGTFHHCVESILQYEHPYWAQFFTGEVAYSYYDANGEVVTYRQQDSNLERRTRESNIFRHFDENDWQVRRISNLEVKAFYMTNCFPKMLQMGRSGISVYYVPSPKEYKFQQ